MHAVSIHRIAASGHILEFTDRRGTRWRVEGYVPDHSGVRCPTERCKAACCQSGYCGSLDYAPAGVETKTERVKAVVNGKETMILATVAAGVCPCLTDDLMCRIHAAKPLGGWTFPETPEDPLAYPGCELRLVKV